MADGCGRVFDFCCPYRFLRSCIPIYGKPQLYEHRSSVFDREGKLPVLLVAFGLVSLAVRCHRHIIGINAVASAMFGVYVLHENAVLRNLLWSEMFPLEQVRTWRAPIAMLIAVIACIVVFGTIIDILRQLLFAMTIDKHYNTWFDAVYDWLCSCEVAQWLRASLQPVRGIMHDVHDTEGRAS